MITGSTILNHFPLNKSSLCHNYNLILKAATLINRGNLVANHILIIKGISQDLCSPLIPPWKTMTLRSRSLNKIQWEQLITTVTLLKLKGPLSILDNSIFNKATTLTHSHPHQSLIKTTTVSLAHQGSLNFFKVILTFWILTLQPTVMR